MPCYFCGEPSTSVEHAPAKSFFPRGNREQLITVPSCTVHNEATSLDDEYVRNVIAMMIGNNGHALNHFLTTCIRSLKRSPALTKRTTGVNRRVFLENIKNVGTGLQPSYMFQIERERIELVLRKISYALFYHKYGRPWERELLIGTEFLVTPDVQQDEIGELIRSAKSDPEYMEPVYEGTNPEIFKYAFLPTEEDNDFEQILQMKFYEGFEAWAIPVTGSTAPKL